jgi:hypothetical protein
MDGRQWQIGERVVLLRSYFVFPSGTTGAITHIYATEPDLYRVRFETSALEVPIFRHYLKISPQPGNNLSAGRRSAEASDVNKAAREM